MPFKARIASLMRKGAVAMMIAGAMICSNSAGALAQQTFVSPSTNSSASSLDAPKSETAPHLEIALADDGDRLFYGSHQTGVRGEPSVGSPVSATFRNQAGAKAYSLLNEGSAFGTFRYGHPSINSTPNQPSPDWNSAASEVGDARRPLFRVNFGRWQVPVWLSAAASQ